MYSSCCRGLLRVRGLLSGSRGFTLIEAMIVVGIIAIVAALAYPSYIDQVRKTRRADAESSLLATAQTLERCFTRFNAYDSLSCPALPTASDDGYYSITVTRTATTYSISAAPQGDQASDACGTYGIDHLGNKSPPPGPKRCWGSSG